MAGVPILPPSRALLPFHSPVKLSRHMVATYLHNADDIGFREQEQGINDVDQARLSHGGQIRSSIIKTIPIALTLIAAGISLLMNEGIDPCFGTTTIAIGLVIFMIRAVHLTQKAKIFAHDKRMECNEVAETLRRARKAEVFLFKAIADRLTDDEVEKGEEVLRLLEACDPSEVTRLLDEIIHLTEQQHSFTDAEKRLINLLLLNIHEIRIADGPHNAALTKRIEFIAKALECSSLSTYKCQEILISLGTENCIGMVRHCLHFVEMMGSHLPGPKLWETLQTISGMTRRLMQTDFNLVLLDRCANEGECRGVLQDFIGSLDSVGAVQFLSHVYLAYRERNRRDPRPQKVFCAICSLFYLNIDRAVFPGTLQFLTSIASMRFETEWAVPLIMRLLEACDPSEVTRLLDEIIHLTEQRHSFTHAEKRLIDLLLLNIHEIRIADGPHDAALTKRIEFIAKALEYSSLTAGLRVKILISLGTENCIGMVQHCLNPVGMMGSHLPGPKLWETLQTIPGMTRHLMQTDFNLVLLDRCANEEECRCILEGFIGSLDPAGAVRFLSHVYLRCRERHRCNLHLQKVFSAICSLFCPNINRAVFPNTLQFLTSIASMRSETEWAVPLVERFVRGLPDEELGRLMREVASTSAPDADQIEVMTIAWKVVLSNHRAVYESVMTDHLRNWIDNSNIHLMGIFLDYPGIVALRAPNVAHFLTLVMTRIDDAEARAHIEAVIKVLSGERLSDFIRDIGSIRSPNPDQLVVIAIALQVTKKQAGQRYYKELLRAQLNNYIAMDRENTPLLDTLEIDSELVASLDGVNMVQLLTVLSKESDIQPFIDNLSGDKLESFIHELCSIPSPTRSQSAVIVAAMSVTSFRIERFTRSYAQLLHTLVTRWIITGGPDMRAFASSDGVMPDPVIGEPRFISNLTTRNIPSLEVIPRMSDVQIEELISPLPARKLVTFTGWLSSIALPTPNESRVIAAALRVTKGPPHEEHYKYFLRDLVMHNPLRIISLGATPDMSDVQIEELIRPLPEDKLITFIRGLSSIASPTLDESRVIAAALRVTKSFHSQKHYKQLLTTFLTRWITTGGSNICALVLRDLVVANPLIIASLEGIIPYMSDVQIEELIRPLPEDNLAAFISELSSIASPTLDESRVIGAALRVTKSVSNQTYHKQLLTTLLTRWITTGNPNMHALAFSDLVVTNPLIIASLEGIIPHMLTIHIEPLIKALPDARLQEFIYSLTSPLSHDRLRLFAIALKVAKDRPNQAHYDYLMRTHVRPCFQSWTAAMDMGLVAILVNYPLVIASEVLHEDNHFGVRDKSAEKQIGYEGLSPQFKTLISICQNMTPGNRALFLGHLTRSGRAGNFLKLWAKNYESWVKESGEL